MKDIFAGAETMWNVLDLLEGRRVSMPYVDIEAIVREINTLLDQQLIFLNRDLHGVDISDWQEYESRYSKIRLLCEQLGGEADTHEKAQEPSLKAQEPSLMVM
jgi:hypothetical protein